VQLAIAHARRIGEPGTWCTHPTRSARDSRAARGSAWHSTRAAPCRNKSKSPDLCPLVDAVFLPILGVTGPFDEVNRHLLFDPLVDLSRWIVEPVDPLALAPYLLREPVHAGGAPEILFQTAGLDEVASTLAIESMLTASGTTQVTRYNPAAHSMIEVLNQVSRYEPPAAPPFVLRLAALPIVNAIAAAHDEIAAFIAANIAPEP